MLSTTVQTSNQKELVRLLYLEHGHQKASELSGVNYGLVRQWAVRGNWIQERKQALSQNVTKLVADNVQSELARLEHKTRTSLARSAANMAEKAETATLRASGQVHNVAKTAAIVHRWDSKSENSQNVVVNVALLGVQPAEVSATVIDVDSEGQDSGA